MSKKRKLFIAALQPLVALLIVVFVIIGYRFESLGWFSSNTNTTANGMNVVVSTNDYDIYVGKKTEYDRTETIQGNEVAVYSGMSDFKEALDATINTTNVPITGGSIGVELVSDYSYDTDTFDDVKNLIPGSFGYMEFYIKKKVQSDITVTLNINISGYKKVGNDIIQPTSDDEFDDATRMLKGHFLFFGGRTITNQDLSTRTYSDFINGSFTYNTQGKTPEVISGENYYHITIYWEWPVLYEEITTKLGTKYPILLLEDYLDDHPEYFFADEDVTTFDEKVFSYNDGDQLIGENINYLVVVLS